MNHEKLIESVKSWEALYAMNHARYSDTAFKENAWGAISKEINQTAALCKRTWTSLRDSYRRALKRKRETKSGQAASKIKKWKYDDEMSFLKPYMQERETSTNLTELSDDDNENEQNTDECNVNNDDREDDDGNDNGSDDKDHNINNDVDNDASNTHNEKIRQTKINRNTITKVRRDKVKKPQAQSEMASAVVMKYLLEKKTANAAISPPSKQPSATESFFSSIGKTVESFSPYFQNIAKSRIFAIVTHLEMQQIMQQQPFLMPNAPTQRPRHAPIPTIPQQSHQMYETGQYNVSPSSMSTSTVTTPNPSPSTSTTPTPSPLYHGLPEPNDMNF